MKYFKILLVILFSPIFIIGFGLWASSLSLIYMDIYYSIFTDEKVLLDQMDIIRYMLFFIWTLIGAMFFRDSK